MSALLVVPSPCDEAGRVYARPAPSWNAVVLWKLGEVAERGWRAEDLGAVVCEQARHAFRTSHPDVEVSITEIGMPDDRPGVA